MKLKRNMQLRIKKPQLKTLQEDFFNTLRFESLEYGRTRHWIKDSPKVSKSTRMGVYIYAYYSRLIDVLKLDFEHTARLLGKKRYEVLAKNYIRARPSRYTNLADLGANFAQFLAKQAVSKSLKELAKLEWHICEAYYVDELTSEGLKPLEYAAEMPPKSIKFALDPSARIFKTQFNLSSLIEGKRAIRRRPEILLIYRNRRGFGRVIPISISTQRIFSAIKKGKSLDAISSLKGLKPSDVKLAFEVLSSSSVVKGIREKKFKT